MMSFIKNLFGIPPQTFEEGDLVKFEGPGAFYGEVGIIAGETFKLSSGPNSHRIVPVLYENKIIDVNPCFLKKV